MYVILNYARIGQILVEKMVKLKYGIDIFHIISDVLLGHKLFVKLSRYRLCPVVKQLVRELIRVGVFSKGKLTGSVVEL